MMFSSNTFVKGLMMAALALPALAQISADDGKHTQFALVRDAPPPAPPAQLAAIPESCVAVCNEGRDTPQTQSIKELIYGVKPAQPCAANDTACLCTAFDNVQCSCEVFNGSLGTLASCFDCYQKAASEDQAKKDQPILEGLMQEVVDRCAPVNVALQPVPFNVPKDQ